MTTLYGTFPNKTIEEMTEDAGPGELNWLTFRGRQHGRYRSDRPQITMGAKGSFYLNQAAFRALGEPRAVELLLDDMRRVIGMMPSDPLKKNAFTVKPHGRKNTTCKRIPASAFCQHFQISTAGTLLFNDPEFDADGILRLDLVNTTRIGRGAR